MPWWSSRQAGREPRETHPYLGLFGALLLLFIVNPFVLSGASGSLGTHLSLHVVSLVIVVMAILAIRWDRRVFVAALVLAGPRELLHFVALTAGRSELLPLVHGLSMVLFSLVGVRVLSDVVGHRSVSRITLLGAACVYLLMGLVWSDLFIVLEWLQPGSFQFAGDAGGPSASTPVGAAELLYLSYITLTGIGYGDIVPVRLPARMLASLEGLLSHLYIAILIARLVAVQVTRPAEEVR